MAQNPVGHPRVRSIQATLIRRRLTIGGAARDHERLDSVRLVDHAALSNVAGADVASPPSRPLGRWKMNKFPSAMPPPSVTLLAVTTSRPTHKDALKEWIAFKDAALQ